LCDGRQSADHERSVLDSDATQFIQCIEGDQVTRRLALSLVVRQQLRAAGEERGIGAQALA
jgi:hypothetical protein